MNKLGSKNSFHHLQLNCVISYFFKLHLMLHACVQKFDVTENFEKNLELNRTLQFRSCEQGEVCSRRERFG